jgi:hypothetical protein
MFKLNEVLRNDDAGADGGGGGDAPAAIVPDMTLSGGDTPLSPAPVEPAAVAPVAPAAPAVQAPVGAGNLFTESLPAEWREQTVQALGIEDTATRDKYIGQLSRYSTFDKFAGAFFEQRELISKGQHSQGLAENATPEQLTEYREQNGIPATADDYKLTLEDGLVLGDDDQRIMQGVAAVAHKYNVKPAQLSEMTAAMLKGRVAEQDAIMAQHGIDQQTCTRQIKDAWGSDHQTNLNVIRGLASSLPESIRDNFLSAQLANGKMLFNSPEFMVWMADVARQLNPSATVVPNSSNPGQAINDELKKLEGIMRNEPDTWYKDPGLERRYLELTTAQEKMSA